MGGECAFRESYNSSEYSWYRATRHNALREVLKVRDAEETVIFFRN